MGVFFYDLNYTLVLYKKNFVLCTIEKSFDWLELLGRRCANGLKLYICRGNIIQMLKSAFSWQTTKRAMPKLGLKFLTKEFHDLLPLE